MRPFHSLVYSSILVSVSAGRAHGTEPAPDAARPVEAAGRSAASLELGLLDPLHHTVRFGRNGSRFDYVREGGQDVLFFTWRLSAELGLGQRHTLILLYQPLDLETKETLRRDLVVDDLVFPAGTPVDFRYGFDFYRVSYLYRGWIGRARDEVAFGASLQMRNAVIDFTSADGRLRRSRRDVGPVPELKLRASRSLTERVWIGFEADGIYAPIRYLNGGQSDVVGAILDLSLRVGYRTSPLVDLFFNLRYLGGGAEGTSRSDAERGPGDGYTSNWLHLLGSTLGARLELERLSD